MTSRHLAMSRAMRSRISSGVLATRIHAEAERLLLEVRRGQSAVDVGVEDLQHIDRQPGGRCDAVPAGDYIVWEPAFPDCRHVLQQRITLLAGGGDDPDLARADLALQSGIEIEPDIDVAAQQRRHQVRRGAIRDDREIGAGHLLEQVRRKILRAARD